MSPFDTYFYQSLGRKEAMYMCISLRLLIEDDNYKHSIYILNKYVKLERRQWNKVERQKREKEREGINVIRPNNLRQQQKALDCYILQLSSIYHNEPIVGYLQ